jgi:hypothetical protein
MRMPCDMRQTISHRKDEKDDVDFLQADWTFGVMIWAGIVDVNVFKLRGS